MPIVSHELVLTAPGYTTPNTLASLGITGLWAEWPMTEGLGTTIGDISGNSRDAAFAASENDPSWDPLGVSFDGNDFATFPTYTLDGVFTFVWVSPWLDGDAYWSKVGEARRFASASQTLLNLRISVNRTIAIGDPSAGQKRLIVRRNGSDLCEFFVNGVKEVNSVTVSETGTFDRLSEDVGGLSGVMNYATIYDAEVSDADIALIDTRLASILTSRGVTF